MESFGQFLRRLRGDVALTQIARNTVIEADFLAAVETGAVIVPQDLARHILLSGLLVTPRATELVLLEVKLTDLGLREGTVQQILRQVDLELAATIVAS